MAQILVVDDDPEFGMMLSRMLRRLGHDVRLTPRSRDVVARDAAAGADLMLTDIFMPDIEGLELIRWVRRHQPALKVIAMSGGTALLPGFDPLRNAASLGADAILSKPFEPESLGALVARTLAGAAAAPLPAAPPAQVGHASTA